MEVAQTDVVVVGSLMIDLVAYTPSLPAIGETILGTTFERNFGGKGANQAVQAARLGVSTRIIGLVGADTYGSQYLESLSAQGVATDCVARVQDASSGIASIWVDQMGRNSIVIVPGANSMMTTSLIDQHRSAILGANIVLLQNEIPMDVTEYTLKLVRSHNAGCAGSGRPGITSIFNPAPASLACRQVIPYCDILCANEVELGMLSARPVDSIEQVISACKHILRTAGCRVVVATVGERGAVLVKLPSCDGHQCFPSALPSEQETDNEHFEAVVCPAQASSAVDTVGAGDSFIGCMAANLSLGSSLEIAVQRAVACASYSVQRKGAQASYIGLEEARAANMVAALS